ncbi:glycosyltransferase family 2 protein [Arenimonas sp.]|uniref:glycosyltransferase family 2 protein n=1 Tax=Arenimonas sp. TaxID=1872635 RepID=UPI0039E2EEB3
MTVEPLLSPVLSVIIPSYNTASTIERAIGSVRVAAGDLPVEVVIVDDGSSDESMAVLEKCALAWPAVRVLTHPGHVNRGIAGTRNFGIAEAKGRFLAFLDADDEMLPNRFEVSVPMLNGDAGIDAIVEPYELVHAGGSRSDAMKAGPVFIPISMADPLEAFRMAMQSGRLPHTTSITVRKTALEDAGGFPEYLRFNLEKPLWLKLFAGGRVANGSDRPVARYYLHDSSTCAKNEHKAAFRLEDILAYTDVYAWMKSAKVDEAARNMVRSKIRGKYLHYCSYVNALEHRIWRDRFWPSFHVAAAMPDLMMDASYWKASLRMMLGLSNVTAEGARL